MELVKHSQNSQNSKFAMSLQYVKKEVRNEVDFLAVDKHQSFLQVDFNTLGINVSCKVILSSLMDISSILKVLKVTSLQYLYNISKKKLGMESIFLHADKHLNFHKLAFLNLYQHAKKSVHFIKLTLEITKHSDTFWGSSHVCCYLFLGSCGQKWA